MPDFLFLMESRLTPDEQAAVQRVLNLAAEQALNVFLVGGALRDMLCGFPIRDLDFAVEGNAMKIIRAIEKLPGVEEVDVNTEWRAAQFIFPGEVPVEIAQCRSEHYLKASAPPVVGFAGIQEDLRRRDFSMNGIGLSLNPASRGLVLDPSNGIGDIERREIRAVHNYALADDPSRMLRLVRLRTRLHFSLDPKTESQFQAAKERGLIEHALPHPLKMEFREISHELSPREVIKALDREGLMTAFHPKLTGTRLNLPAIQKMEKTARWLEEHGLTPRIYAPLLFFLTRKLPPADRAAFAKRLRMKRAESDPWMKLEESAKKLVRLLNSKKANTPSKAFDVLSAEPAELLLFILLHFPQKKIQDKIKNYITKHRAARERLPRKELLGMGVAADSPRGQKILGLFFAALLDGKVKSRTEQLKYLKKLVAEAKA
jgi:tRNA nucleotidyltransferase/poly(A) polymerase